MAFVTRLRLSSGDRDVLDRVVEDIKATAEQKGTELSGPHSPPPTELSVPLYDRSPPGDDPTVVDTWRYTAYVRELEIVGRSEFARGVAERDFPDSVRVEVEVDRRTGL